MIHNVVGIPDDDERQPAGYQALCQHVALPFGQSAFKSLVQRFDE